MTEITECPICRGKDEAKFKILSKLGDHEEIDCDQCGQFKIERSLLVGTDFDITPMERARVSHAVRRAQSNEDVPFISSYWLEDFLKNTKNPTPIEQSRRLIEVVGDFVLSKGTAVPLFIPKDVAEIGCFDLRRLSNLCQKLRSKELVSALQRPPPGYDLSEIDLTLEGWAEYEAQKGGLRAGNYGFLATKFGDPPLDEFISKILKPCVQDKLKYELVDMRDIPEAGIIDNLMREKIRDAAFILADLTHDNFGAYWEAGYAEGLGKPVIYICEQSKYDSAKTHFNTNHCTTVTWSTDETDHFEKELIATLRRSLGLFA